MTPIQYLTKNGCSSSDLASLQRTDKKAFESLKEDAAKEMTLLGIEVTGSPATPTA